MLFNEREVYIKGSLIYENEPDWDLLSWELEHLERTTRFFHLTAERAIQREDDRQRRRIQPQ